MKNKQTKTLSKTKNQTWYFVAMHILLWKAYLSWDLSIMVSQCSVMAESVFSWNNGNCDAWLGPEAPLEEELVAQLLGMQSADGLQLSARSGIIWAALPKVTPLPGWFKGMIILPQLRTILKIILTLELPVGLAKAIVRATLHLNFFLPSSSASFFSFH